MDVSGKTVLLTGASSGLGPHIARRLHRGGLKLILSARNEAAMRDLARELGGARIIVADLSRPDGAEALARAARRVDVLVSNAGVAVAGRLTSLAVAEIDHAIAVNLRAGMVLARLLAPAMIRRGSGHLLFMSSMAGRFSVAGATVYNATKFALRGFALALREELWGTGVGVSVVCPTFVSEAGMWAKGGLKAHPLAGEVTPVDVAAAVWSAIVRNRAEVDVAGLPLRAGMIAQAVAPDLVEAVGRLSGAARIGDEFRRRQRSRR